ncbi:Amino acid permease OS=Streptomyces tendae OX=1932 GN=GUR47_22095 PE=4 SV=1 [Streptomyces tendae]
MDPRTRTPVAAVWLAALAALVLGLPYLINVTAYAAVTSIAVIGLYIAYVIPTLLRVRKGAAFERGPWRLGRWSQPVGVVAVTWVGVITVLFMLPSLAGHLGDLQLRAHRRPGRPGLRRHLVAGLARHWFLNPDHERTRARAAARAGAPEPVDP